MGIGVPPLGEQSSLGAKLTPHLHVVLRLRWEELYLISHYVQTFCLNDRASLISNNGETNWMQQLVILLLINCSSTCFGRKDTRNMLRNN